MSTTGKAQSAPREIKGGFEAEHIIRMNLGSASRKTDLSKYIRANGADSRWSVALGNTENRLGWVRSPKSLQGATYHFHISSKRAIPPAGLEESQHAQCHCPQSVPSLLSHPFTQASLTIPSHSIPLLGTDPARLPPGDWRRNFTREESLVGEYQVLMAP